MRNRTFFWFVLPSLVAMIVFIALPILSVCVQSLFIEQPRVMIEAESCGPFGCDKELRVDEEATLQAQRAHPLGLYNGLGTYIDRNHLAFEEIAARWSSASSVAEFVRAVALLPFYRALGFTLTYAFVVTPLVIALGFVIALAVNALPSILRGGIIFASLLPMIVTPLIGSLVLFWMIDANGVIGATLQWLWNDPSFSLKASVGLTWITLLIYGIWQSTPFAFVVFYAGLQTLPRDTVESAMIDGASRWEQTRYVVIPHLMPLATFVALIQVMDNFRVFEPIVGFNAEASAISLSWLVFNDLQGRGVQLFGSAAATSVMTIIGVSLLLMPVLQRVWHDFSRKR
jgi:ABC-type sugar transport system permease subunit